MIWSKKITIEEIKEMDIESCSTYLGIEFTKIGADYLKASMPVDTRTKQPFGILHGGASCVLAETIGSIASALCVDNPYQDRPVGISINANHIRSVSEGKVYALCKPINIGRKLHVWNIEITNEKGKMVCVSRLTVMIVRSA